MIASLYIAGLIFLALGVATGSAVAWVSAAFFLSSEPMRLLLESAFANPFPRFAYFALVAAVFGVYLFSTGNPILAFSAGACLFAALVIMLASKQAYMGDYFYRTWDYYSAGINMAIIAPILLYLGGVVRL